MPTTYTKAQASKLLNATEMKLFEESRIAMLRKFSASQLDRRIERTRALRDKSRDLLQRQRVALQQQTGSRRGERGTADQQRSKDKVALVADILKRFEGQLKIARKNEKAGILPKGAPPRRVTKKAAIAKKKAPHGDFTASRMRARNVMEEEAGRTMKARKATTGKATAKKSATTKTPAKKATKAATKAAPKKTAAKKASTAKPAAKKTTAPAKRASKKAAVAVRPQDTLPGGDTSGKRTRDVHALNNVQGNVHGGFADARSHNIAQQRKFEAALVTPIQAHISSRGRRNQGKRDQRG